MVDIAHPGDRGQCRPPLEYLEDISSTVLSCRELHVLGSSNDFFSKNCPQENGDIRLVSPRDASYILNVYHKIGFAGSVPHTFLSPIPFPAPPSRPWGLVLSVQHGRAGTETCEPNCWLPSAEVKSRTGRGEGHACVHIVNLSVLNHTLSLPSRHTIRGCWSSP